MYICMCIYIRIHMYENRTMYRPPHGQAHGAGPGPWPGLFAYSFLLSFFCYGASAAPLGCDSNAIGALGLTKQHING